MYGDNDWCGEFGHLKGMKRGETKGRKGTGLGSDDEGDKGKSENEVCCVCVVLGFGVITGGNSGRGRNVIGKQGVECRGRRR